jgi:tetratricopeptide (TPR) repeat protein
MPLATEESKKSANKSSQPQSSWGIRFIIAIAGAALSFWLASRHNVHNLPPLPTFHDRLWLVAPALFEGAVGILFLIWIGLLFREAGERATPRIIGSTTATDAAKKKRWSALKTALFVVYILVTIPSFGGAYFEYLWPGYPQWISHAARPVFDALTFLGAFVGSTRRRRDQKPEPGTGYGDEKGPWLDDRQKTFIAVALLGVAAVFLIHHAARNLPPSAVGRITAISSLVVAAVLVAILQTTKKPAQSAPQSEIQQRSLIAGDGTPGRRKWSGKVVIWVVVTACMAVVFLPVPHEIKTIAVFTPIGILILWVVALTKLKMWIHGLARQGDFDRAIQMDRRLSWIPGYGTPLEGSILFNAGRYPEARTFIRPFAFDEQGMPKLSSTALYTYALALENDGMEAEAQKLLEAAVRVPQRTAGFHVALATCLLSQKKDAERARELLETALATTDVRPSSSGQNADYARRLGRYAWALAACGRRDDTEAQLKKAFAGSGRLKERDLAGLHYFAGEAWRSLGEWKKARTAFEEALRLSPDGSAATSAQKAMAKMREEAQA